MANFILSWGGDYTDSIKIDNLYKWMLSGKNILYIPRAMRPEKYPSCLEWIQNTFPIDEWYTVHLLSEQEFLQHSQEYLSIYDGIYIWGGNTYRLLKLFKDTWFWHIIMDFVDNNKPIYGWSAWAIIMGKEIHTAPDMNAVKLLFEESMWYNLCRDYSIACHYKESQSNEIADYTSHYQIPVICLPEWTGIVCQDGVYTISWEKSAYMIDTKWDIQELITWSTF